MDPEHVVLLVQPHGDSREMYAEFLRRNGFSILAVDNGHDALSAAVDAHIIVTGILVPGLDGLELIARLRSDTRTKNKAIIVLTACAFPADRARAEHAGCDVFLPMPCAPDELLRHVRRLLPRRFQGTPVKAERSRHRIERKRSA